jgi:hypothetical protein
MVPFANGEPVAAPDSTAAAIDIFANADINACPNKCFRPVGLAFDNQGRLFISSDATGEIYIIVKDSSTSTQSSSGTQPSQTGAGSAARVATRGMFGLLFLAGYIAFG